MNAFIVSKVKGERVSKRRRWVQSVSVLQGSGGQGARGVAAAPAETQTPAPMPIPLSSSARTLQTGP